MPLAESQRSRPDRRLRARLVTCCVPQPAGRPVTLRDRPRMAWIRGHDASVIAESFVGRGSESARRYLGPTGIMAVQDLKGGVAMAVLAGRAAVVTGASAGIGAGLAAMLAAEGAKVVLAARRETEPAGVADGIRQRGGVAIPVLDHQHRQRGGGGHRPWPGAYCVAKHALVALTEVIQDDNHLRQRHQGLGHLPRFRRHRHGLRRPRRQPRQLPDGGGGGRHGPLPAAHWRQREIWPADLAAHHAQPHGG